MKQTIKDFVNEALSEALSVIPTLKNNHPAVKELKPYFSTLIEEKDFKESFGIGLIFGKVSGGLEGIDFDDHDGTHGIKKIFIEFTKNPVVLNLIKNKRIYVEETRSGGFHIIYKYETKEYEGAKVLARWNDGEVMIETKGEGGYFVIAPTPKYKALSGDLIKLDTLEKEERDMLITISKSLNQFSKITDVSTTDKEMRTEATDPISVFNIEKIAYAKFLLEENGWNKTHSDNDVEYWARPGKEGGTSATWGYKYNSLYIWSTNAAPFAHGFYYTPFQVLIKLRFKGNFDKAMAWVTGKELKKDNKIPYIRVGADYYKTFYKKNRFNTYLKELKPWKKDEIKEDHGREFLKEIPHYDDFTIEPNNIDYQQVVGNCYNLYSEFPHTPAHGSTKWSMVLMQHIFGEQVEMGMKYMQALYMYPKRALPILALVSSERSTGKTTFINWISMLFVGNMAPLTNEDMTNNFNSQFATKNIISIEETSLEKSSASEKLKAISTSKEITVNQKFVSGYKVPLYLKIILASNNEDKFIKIDDKEIRYWVRKIDNPTVKRADIEKDLIEEIPAFIYELSQMPKLEWKQSRQLFETATLETRALNRVKENSRSGLYKDLFEYFTNIFEDNEDMSYFFARPKEIKERFFPSNSRIEANYIRRVLDSEFNFKITTENKRHEPFKNGKGLCNGKPFVIPRKFFIDETGVVDFEKAPELYIRIEDADLPF